MPLYELLGRIGDLSRSIERRAAQEHGLLPLHLRILSYLDRCNRYSNTPLGVADYFGATKGTISQSLKLLASKGLVAFEPDARDGRKVHCSLTGDGRAVLRQTLPPEAFERAASGDRSVLERELESLLRGLQESNEYRSFGVCRTCRLFRTRPSGQTYCGLTGEDLSQGDVRRICREHEAA